MSLRCDLVVSVGIIGYIREFVGHLKVCYGTWLIDLDEFAMVMFHSYVAMLIYWGGTLRKSENMLFVGEF